MTPNDNTVVLDGDGTSARFAALFAGWNVETLSDNAGRVGKREKRSTRRTTSEYGETDSVWRGDLEGTYLVGVNRRFSMSTMDLCCLVQRIIVNIREGGLGIPSHWVNDC